MPELLTTNRLADAFDLDRRTVRRRLARASVEPAERRGREAHYRLREAAEALLEPEILARLPATGAEGPEPPSTEAEARRRERIARARLAELEAAEREGHLLDADEVRRASASVDYAVRARVLGLAGATTARIYAAASLTQARRIHEEAIREALEAIAEGPPEPDDDDEGGEAA